MSQSPLDAARVLVRGTNDPRKIHCFYALASNKSRTLVVAVQTYRHRHSFHGWLSHLVHSMLPASLLGRVKFSSSYAWHVESPIQSRCL